MTKASNDRFYEAGWGGQIPPLLDIYKDNFGYKEGGYFVEVGAFDCHHWSNTWGLARAGWRGIYYEPQPDLVSKCREYFGHYENITIQEMALSDNPGVATLYLGGSLSTISEETKDAYLQIPWAQSTGLGSGDSIEVAVSTLDIELPKHDWPKRFDVLVVDVEGSEIDVLNGFSIMEWLPTLCIVETHEDKADATLSMKAPEINEFFELAGYDKIYSDTINSIYKMGISPHVKEHES